MHQSQSEKELLQLFLGTTTDKQQNKAIIYSQSNVYQLQFNDERDLWRDFLTQHKFDEALEEAQNIQQRH